MGNAQNTNDLDTLDLTMMTRALELARRGAGFTAPNPMVGCVIARGAQIVGEGWHRGRGWHPRDGLAHAEAEALRSAGNAARGATAYVTLEPCAHHGATPPCAQALIKAGIARLVYAMADPNPTAAGGGDVLRKAGIITEHGLCREQAETLNRPWLHRLRHRRPFVIAKFAASLDGKIAAANGDSKWITSAPARARAHDLRQACDAIIVGAGTIIADNPRLTVRGRSPASHPLRVILDGTARTNPLAKVYQPETPGTALLVTTENASAQKLAAFKARNIATLTLPADPHGHPRLPDLLADLADRGLNSVMVEGGSAVLGSFFAGALVDEVWAFVAPVIIGSNGKSAISGGGDNIPTMAEALRLTDITTETHGPDILMRGILMRSPLPPSPPLAAQEDISCSQA